ncbi:hypothetical protein [Embleya sp. NPDC059259]|uniref:hypothetical protein n=1 Tax=unclassified Embleya TaxID=2699296 RepID=UPI0036827691
MTADRHPIAASIPDPHRCIPREYSQLQGTGKHFDLVRIASLHGEGVAKAIRTFCTPS